LERRYTSLQQAGTIPVSQKSLMNRGAWVFRMQPAMRRPVTRSGMLFLRWIVPGMTFPISAVYLTQSFLKSSVWQERRKQVRRLIESAGRRRADHVFAFVFAQRSLSPHLL
jgi:hypothetical protein